MYIFPQNANSALRAFTKSVTGSADLESALAKLSKTVDYYCSHMKSHEELEKPDNTTVLPSYRKAELRYQEARELGRESVHMSCRLCKESPRDLHNATYVRNHGICMKCVVGGTKK